MSIDCLEPCPKGHDAFYPKRPLGNCCFITCAECGLEVYGKTHEEAEKKWNQLSLTSRLGKMIVDKGITAETTTRQFFIGDVVIEGKKEWDEEIREVWKELYKKEKS